MLKRRLQYSRMAALVVVFGMAASGVNSLLFSSAASNSTGDIKVATFAFVDNQAVPIGDVGVVVQSVGGSQRCDDNSRVIPAGGDRTVTFTNCQVALSGGPKQYKLASPPTRDGYGFRSLHMATPGLEISPEGYFPVKAGQTTFLHIYMDPPPTFNPPPPQEPKETSYTPPSAPSPSIPNPTGSVKVTSYAFYDNGVIPIGNVKVAIQSIGNMQKCDSNTKTTPQGGDHAVTFNNCEVANDGGDKQYELISATRDGYAMRGNLRINSGGNQTVSSDNRFTVKKGETTSLVIWMTPPANFVPPPISQPGGYLPPSGGGGGTGGSSSHKNGTIEVTSYTYLSEGNIVRQGNVKVSVHSVNTDNHPDHSCDQTEKVTDVVGGPNAANPNSNPNYAQATFANCWTSNDGAKQYEISRLELPSGYALRRLNILDGKFISGSTHSSSMGERFNVAANQKARLTIWMTKVGSPVVAVPTLTAQGNPSDPNNPASPILATAAGSNPAGVGAVHQVVTKNGISYVAAKNNEASKTLATLLNTLINPNQLDPTNVTGTNNGAVPDKCKVDDPPEECDIDPCDADNPPEDCAIDPCDGDNPPDDCNEDMDPPTVPASLSAQQDPSGSIVLSWGKSTGNPPEEEVKYIVERYEAGNENPEEFEALGAEYLDKQDLKYPKEYTYNIYSVDLNDNTSDAASVTIVTQPPEANVSREIGQQQESPNDNGQPQPDNPAESPSIPISSPSLPVTVNIPTNAHPEPMACAVGETGDDSDLLTSIGDTVVDPSQLVCREEDGELVEDFDEELETEIELEDEEIEDSELYVFDGTDWQEVSADEDGESKVEGTLAQYASAKREKGVKGAKSKLKVKSKKPIKLAVIKRTNSNASKAIFILPPLVLLAGGAWYVLRRRQVVPALNETPGLKDIDLMPIKRDETLDNIQPLNQIELPTNHAGVQPEQVIKPEAWRREQDNDQQ